MRSIAPIVKARISPRGALRGLLVLAAIAFPACIFDLAEVVPAGSGRSTTTSGSTGGSGGTAGNGGAACVVGSPVIEPLNKETNSSFEGGTSNWDTENGTIEAIALSGAPAGGKVLRLTLDGPAIDRMAIKDHTDPVPMTAVGERYHASAWVRTAPGSSQPGAKVVLFLTVNNGDTLAKGPELTLTECFQLVEVSADAIKNGDSIGVRVRYADPIPGAALDVDLVQIVVEELVDGGGPG